MRTKAFDFELPPHLIAQHPLPNRTDSRLLVYHANATAVQHDYFRNLSQFLHPGDLLVFNNSKVVKARLFALKETGGRVELLVERQLTPHLFLAHIKASKAPKAGTKLVLVSKTMSYKTELHSPMIVVEEKQERLYQCRVDQPLSEVLEQHGHIPLPPYIQRQETKEDESRYQTVYAKTAGSVAAPTAGLHFDEKMLTQLAESTVQTGFVTLHVGAGTFQPVRTEWIQDHKIHQEWMQVDDELCHQVETTKRNKGRVIAVGTTALRALETAGRCGMLKPFTGDTSIFIYPGHTFNVADGLITNFHLPESSLLMLVAAFIGYEQTIRLYQEAVQQEYRFFSYGDVSLMIP